jgi:hypothetical protein
MVKSGVAKSRYECQLFAYPKVSLNLDFKNSTKEDSSLKSATPSATVRDKAKAI